MNVTKLTELFCKYANRQPQLRDQKQPSLKSDYFDTYNSLQETSQETPIYEEPRVPKIRSQKQPSLKFIKLSDIEITFKQINKLTSDEISYLIKNKLYASEGFAMIRIYKNANTFSDSCFIYFAKYKSKIVSVLTVIGNEYGKQYSAGHCDIYTLPEYREQGIGTMLINEAKKRYSTLNGGVDHYFYSKAINNKDPETNNKPRRNRSADAEKDFWINDLLNKGFALEDIDEHGRLIDPELDEIKINTYDPIMLRRKIIEYKKKNYPQQTLPNVDV